MKKDNVKDNNGINFPTGTADSIRQEESFEPGIIESVSPQGDYTFAVVRRKGDEVKDVDLNVVRANTYLFGNKYNLPESQVSLHELLIPLDISGNITTINYEQLIGEEVMVEVRGGRPIMAYLDIKVKTPRSIHPKDIDQARLLSDDLDISSKEAVDHLKAVGYKEEEIKDVTKQFYETLEVNGKIISYGTVVTNHKTSQQDGKSEQDITKKGILESSVTGLPTTKLKEKSCHSHIGIFSAK